LSGLTSLLKKTLIGDFLFAKPLRSTEIYQPKAMTKLTGIKAFEARWQLFQNSHQISSSNSLLLMQSMGRLVDNYATQEEISRDLPASLKSVFDWLVDAYLNGFWIEADQKEIIRSSVQSPGQSYTQVGKVSPALLAASELRQRRKAQPTQFSEAATYITNDTLERLSDSAFGSVAA